MVWEKLARLHDVHYIYFEVPKYSSHAFTLAFDRPLFYCRVQYCFNSYSPSPSNPVPDPNTSNARIDKD